MSVNIKKSITIFIVFLLIIVVVSANGEWAVPIEFKSENTTIVIMFGTNIGATDGFDKGIDEPQPPPPPSSAKREMYFSGNLFNKIKDFRAPLNASNKEIIWPLVVKSDGAISLSWDPPAVDKLILNMNIDGHDIDMASTSTHNLAANNYLGSISARSESVAKPEAGFIGSPTSGTKPLEVAFTDESTGDGLSGWSWSFGDGSESTDQNPVHTYTEAGTYSVSLTVTGDGGSDTTTENDYITVSAPAPHASFIGNPTSGTKPLKVTFTDKSTGDGLKNWLWSFGDGSESTVQNPVHTYTEAGSYSVSLTVTSDGGSDTTTENDYITVSAPAPRASFIGSPTSGTKPLEVAFTDKSTGDGLKNWSWSFGDGSVSTVQNPVHTYTDAGSYSVSLTVTGDGGSDTTTENDYIEVTTAAPHASFIGNPTSGTKPLKVTFTDKSTGDGLKNWSWSFGDGSVSTVQNPVHTYTEAGSYSVSLTVTGDGGSDTTTENDYIEVTTAAPHASFIGSPTSGTKPLKVTFTDKSTGDGLKNWSWSFGDGSVSTVQNPVHTYTEAGSYSVSLTVTGDGGSDTTTENDYIQVHVAAPRASFIGNPTSGTKPLKVIFADKSTGDGLKNWSWSFGDGLESTDQNPVHTYTEAGSYSVSLTVTGDGGSDTTTENDYITVSAPAPHASFIGSPTSGTKPLKVTFTDKSTGDGLKNWSWSFGDGSVSTVQNPVHTYTEAGSYSVSLTVTGDGGSDTTTENDYIEVTTAAPHASFIGSPTSGTKPLKVTFTDKSTGDGLNNWSWSFGDGSVSTDQNPVHTYTEAGTYSVSLTVTGDGGSDTTTENHYITVSAPTPHAFFIGNPTSGTKPLKVTFTDKSTGDGLKNWSWSFGDGSESTDQNPVHTYTEAGSYNVSLTVTGDGGSDTTTENDYIQVNVAAPRASFIGNPTSGTKPLKVTFTDKSSGDGLKNWSWSFGDGSESTDQNPVHTYTEAGSYSVSLTVTGTDGNATVTENDYIQVHVAAPRASFIGSPTSGTKPLKVTFTDKSTGDGLKNWSWSFGDGSVSTVQNPVHTYTEAGSYSVSLTVTGAGGSDTVTENDYITVSAPAPHASFIGSPTSGTKPLKVTFADKSTGDGLKNWSWSFGDGSVSTVQNPVHTYTDAGSYSVSLTVTGDGGSDTTTENDYIQVHVAAPRASFIGNPTSGTKPLKVTFADKSTGDGLKNWSWSFGDGSVSTVQNPVHTYTEAGNYSVSLTVTGAGGSDTVTENDYITVSAPAPHASFIGSPTSGTKPLKVTFTDKSTGDGLKNWSWSFGDGSESTVQNPVHTYTEAGTYSVSLTVTGAGGDDTETKGGYITVSAPAPHASFIGSPTSGTKPLKVTFTDKSTGDGLKNWSWSFGDGSESTDQNPVHTYTEVGSYNVSLTVAGTDGNATVTENDYIQVHVAAPRASFIGSPTSGTKPLKVTFTDKSTGDGLKNWSWSFGDGSVSTVQNPVHTYTDAGTYSVSLTVTGTDGNATVTENDYIQVHVAAPRASFIGNPTSGTKPLKVTFTDKSTGDGLKNWSWSFGDGSVSTVQNPVHTYTDAGTYSVSLTVIGDGGDDTETKSGYITVSAPAPRASFIGNPTSGTKPLKVTFTDKSSGDGLKNWSWSFGDGSESTVQNPVHTYTEAGSYSVSLTVIGDGGDDTETKSGYITVSAPAPHASFIGSPTSGTKPLKVTFTDKSSGDGLKNWSWSFGDGSASTDQNPVHTYTEAGTYNVSLIVTGAGGSDTATEDRYINVTVPPLNISFNASRTKGPYPLKVNFTDESTGDSISNWSWDVDGNGVEDYLTRNATHIYTKKGLYTVNLTVTDNSGSDTLTKQDYITVTAPPLHVDFEANPASGISPLEVKFTDQSIGDGIYGWSWDVYGDGIEDYRTQNVTHTYYTEGTYSVSLTVTDRNGNDTTVKKNCILVYAGNPPPPNIKWENSVGGSGHEWGAFVSRTNDGGYVATGETWSTDGDVSGNHGQNDIWVVKFDSAGNICWQRCIGGSDTDMGRSIQQTPDGGYIITGNTSSIDGDVSGNHGGSDFLVVKLDSGGDIAWQKCLGGSGYDCGYSILPVTDGGYVVSGTCMPGGGDVVGNHGKYDVWVVKLDSAGDIIWKKCIGGSGYDCGYYIRQTADGGYVVAGISGSNDGDISGNHGNYDLLVVKLDSGGDITWQKCLGGSGYDCGYSIRQTTDGGYILTGETLSTDGDVAGKHAKKDLWVVKLNSAGVLLWQKCAGGNSYDSGYDIIEMTNGGYVAVGQSQSTDRDVTGNHGYYDLWVVKLDLNGHVIWDKCLGGRAYDCGFSLHEAGNGRIIVTGGTCSTNGDVTGKQDESLDLWIVELEPVGTWVLPDANFTSDVTSGYLPLVVSYTDTSTGVGIESRLWDFGDGSVSDLRNPVHTYTEEGNYTVSLTVTGDGTSDMETRHNYIIAAWKKPLPAFTYDPLYPVINGDVSFDASASSVEAGKNIVSYSWDFGDGSSAGAGVRAVHRFVRSGNYPVRLLVTDNKGASNRTAEEISVAAVRQESGFAIDGIDTENGESGQKVTINRAVNNNVVISEENRTITLMDQNNWQKIVISTDNVSSTTGNSITCNVSGVMAQSAPVEADLGGRVGKATVFFDVNLPEIPGKSVKISTEIIDGASEKVKNGFQIAAGNLNITEVIYTMRVNKFNISGTGPARIHMAVDGGWVLEKIGIDPAAVADIGASLYANRDAIEDEIRIIRISDDGTRKEVLDTEYMGYDNPGAMFEADSPNGLSVIGLVHVEKSDSGDEPGSVPTSSGGGSGPSSPSGSGGGGSSGGASLPFLFAPKAPAVEYTTTGIVDSNWGGVVRSSVIIYSKNAVAELELNEGVLALESNGDRLSEITLQPVLSEKIPDPKSGDDFQFAGHAVRCLPEGATFDPAIDLRFVLSEEDWDIIQSGKEFSVRWYNEATNSWEKVPVIVNRNTRTVTAEIKHFSIFGLFTGKVDVGAEPTAAKTTSGVSSEVTQDITSSGYDEEPGEDGFPWIWTLVVFIIMGVVIGGYWKVKTENRTEDP